MHARLELSSWPVGPENAAAIVGYTLGEYNGDCVAGEIVDAVTE